METLIYVNDLNMKATELRLGLPGTDNESDAPQSSSSSSSCVKNNNKRSSSEMNAASLSRQQQSDHAPAQKAQVVGWPPVRSYRKNHVINHNEEQKKKSSSSSSESEGLFVKVRMDGAPYLRKIDLKLYNNYFDLLKGLKEMFMINNSSGYINGSEFVPTYEDRDGDWMLVGDVPWDMFINSCKRLRIMKGSEAKGLELGGCLQL